MICTKSLLPTACAVLVGAVSIWLGFPNDLADIPLFVLGWPCCTAYLGLKSQCKRQAFTRGWLTSFLGTSAALYWLALPMHLVGGLPLAGAAACGLLVTAALSTASGLFTLLVFVYRHLAAWQLSVLLSLFWIFLEVSYAIVAGFPWLPLSGALAMAPLLVQGADIVGAYGISGLWVCVALLCFLALPGILKEHLSAVSMALGLFLAFFLLGYGYLRIPKEVAVDFGDSNTFPVLFVEGNVDQAQKWQPKFQSATVDHYIELTQNGLRKFSEDLNGKIPLVIWPETALPYFFGQRPLLDERTQDMVRRINSPLLLGAPAEGALANTNTREAPVYNRAWLLSPNGEIAGYYDKEHLVPFGEYVPDFLNFSFLAGLLQEVGMYSPGRNPMPLQSGTLSLGMLICYEGIFPWLAQQRVADGADVLVDISNDGWFLKTPAARQHLYLTTVRAIEQGRYLLRGTNTGISAVIDPFGRTVWHGGQFQATSGLGWARTSNALTVYHRNWAWICACGLLLLVSLLLFLRNTKRETS